MALQQKRESRYLVSRMHACIALCCGLVTLLLGYLMFHLGKQIVSNDACFQAVSKNVDRDLKLTRNLGVVAMVVGGVSLAAGVGMAAFRSGSQ